MKSLLPAFFEVEFHAAAHEPERKLDHEPGVGTAVKGAHGRSQHV